MYENEIQDIEQEIEGLKKSQQLLKEFPEFSVPIQKIFGSDRGNLSLTAYLPDKEAIRQSLHEAGFTCYNDFHFYPEYGYYMEYWEMETWRDLVVFYVADGVACERTQIGVYEKPLYEISCGQETW